jgi:predicted DNA-binding ribbon-helix-helix protein
MTEEKMRAFNFEGKRRGIRLDQGTWQSIDWLATQKGVKWAELAREWATFGTHGPMKDDNLTRIIRAAAIQSLLAETIFAEWADMHATLSGPLWASLGTCNDESFDYALQQAESVEGHMDFGGFELHAGVSEFGNVTFYVRNNLRDCSHCIISTPIPYADWARRSEVQQP